MSLYYRNLKRIGICVILVSTVNLVYELLIRRFLAESGSPYLSYIPLPWGIWTKNMIGVASGLAALFFLPEKATLHLRDAAARFSLSRGSSRHHPEHDVQRRPKDKRGI